MFCILALRLQQRPPFTLSPSSCNTLFVLNSALHCAPQHPELGYYTRSGAEVIGSSGDFITAPEISQLFGELLCIWCVATWQDLGCPSSFHIVEAGPGKGTLIAGLLRSSRAFPAFRAALSAVHLVETSSSMREKQAAALGCSLGATDVAGGQVAIPLPASSSSNGTTITTAAGAAASATDTVAAGKRSLSEGLAVHWHRALSEVPSGCTLLLAQELLDALPVHQFEYTAGGWRERLVDIDETSSSSSSSSSSSDQSSSGSSSSSSSGGDAASAGSSDTTTTSSSSSDSSSSASSSSSSEQQQQHSSAGSGLHFRHVLSPKGTPATRLLLEMQGASGIEQKPGGGPWEIGDRLEVCPLAMAFVQEASTSLST
jgi:Putative S-adenosyl-L-methionine-dependent methyltransferase